MTGHEIAQWLRQTDEWWAIIAAEWLRSHEKQPAPNEATFSAQLCAHRCMPVCVVQCRIATRDQLPHVTLTRKQSKDTLIWQDLTLAFQKLRSCSGQMWLWFWTPLLGSEIGTLESEMFTGVYAPGKEYRAQVTARVIHVPCKGRMYLFFFDTWFGSFLPDWKKRVIWFDPSCVDWFLIVDDQTTLRPGAPVPWVCLSVIPAVAASRLGKGQGRTHWTFRKKFWNVGSYKLYTNAWYPAIASWQQFVNHMPLTHHVNSISNGQEDRFQFFGRSKVEYHRVFKAMKTHMLKGYLLRPFVMYPYS